MYLLHSVAMAIYTRSPAAYEALSSFHILQLPGPNTLRSYIRSTRNTEVAGECEKRLASERKKYDARILEHGEKVNPPLSKGVVIFDEVKVAAKLHWNSQNNEIIGHAMTTQEMSTMCDVYEKLDDSSEEAKKTDYVLQTLWRDITSDCDIMYHC